MPRLEYATLQITTPKNIRKLGNQLSLRPVRATPTIILICAIRDGCGAILLEPHCPHACSQPNSRACSTYQWPWQPLLASLYTVQHKNASLLCRISRNKLLLHLLIQTQYQANPVAWTLFAGIGKSQVNAATKKNISDYAILRSWIVIPETEAGPSPIRQISSAFQPEVLPVIEPYHSTAEAWDHGIWCGQSGNGIGISPSPSVFPR